MHSFDSCIICLMQACAAFPVACIHAPRAPLPELCGPQIQRTRSSAVLPLQVRCSRLIGQCWHYLMNCINLLHLSPLSCANCSIVNVPRLDPVCLHANLPTHPSCNAVHAGRWGMRTHADILRSCASNASAACTYKHVNTPIIHSFIKTWLCTQVAGACAHMLTSSDPALTMRLLSVCGRPWT